MAGLESYPVQPGEIATYLSFPLGSALVSAIIAPYHLGDEDCVNAADFLGTEREVPHVALPARYYMAVKLLCQKLIKFFHTMPGDRLWEDIAVHTAEFLLHLVFHVYVPTEDSFAGMEGAIRELRRVLELRDMRGQIYEGMTGLPEMENFDG